MITYLLTLLVVPVLRTMDFLFRGEFVGTVDYLGITVPYAYFILVGLLLNIIVYSVINTTRRLLSGRAPLLLVKSENPFIPILSVSLSGFINSFIYFSIMALLIFLLGVGSALKFLEAYVVAFLAGLPLTISVGTLLGMVGMEIRGRDFSAVIRTVDRGLWILFPAMFGLEVFPETLQRILLYVPSVSLIEGARRFVFGLGGTGLLLYSFFTGVFLFFLSYKLFRKMFERARRTGKIMLV